MPRGGKREGAGRKVGAVTKKTREVAVKASAAGLTPLDYMLTVLRDEDADKADRMWAAEKSAPYIHPRLSAIEANVNHDVSDPIMKLLESIAERNKRLGPDAG